jgi:hypothetical protein
MSVRTTGFGLFPQHGTGKKHTRPISLEDWQERIVNSFPLEFFRGLYHSDGSRFSNVVNGKIIHATSSRISLQNYRTVLQNMDLTAYSGL